MKNGWKKLKMEMRRPLEHYGVLKKRAISKTLANTPGIVRCTMVHVDNL